MVSLTDLKLVIWQVAKVDVLAQTMTPTGADVHFLKDELPHNSITLEHFFHKLESPAWLQPLSTGELFQSPPPPEYDPDKGTISFFQCGRNHGIQREWLHTTRKPSATSSDQWIKSFCRQSRKEPSSARSRPILHDLRRQSTNLRISTDLHQGLVTSGEALKDWHSTGLICLNFVGKPQIEHRNLASFRTRAAWKTIGIGRVYRSRSFCRRHSRASQSDHLFIDKPFGR